METGCHEVKDDSRSPGKSNRRSCPWVVNWGGVASDENVQRAFTADLVGKRKVMVSESQ